MKDTKKFNTESDFYNFWIELMTQSQHNANRINDELDRQKEDLSGISEDLKESNEELIRTKANIETLNLQCCCLLNSVSCCANSKNGADFLVLDRSARNDHYDVIKKHETKHSGLAARRESALG